MSMIKRGSHSAAVVISSSVHVCNKCGHTDMVTDLEVVDDKPCTECKEGIMSCVSSSCSPDEE